MKILSSVFLQTASSYALGLLKSLHTNATLQDWTPFLGEQQLVENTIESFPIFYQFLHVRGLLIKHMRVRVVKCQIFYSIQLLSSLEVPLFSAFGHVIHRYKPRSANRRPTTLNMGTTSSSQLVNYLESDVEFETKYIST